jgi:hypothetical protein
MGIRGVGIPGMCSISSLFISLIKISYIYYRVFLCASSPGELGQEILGSRKLCSRRRRASRIQRCRRRRLGKIPRSYSYPGFNTGPGNFHPSFNAYYPTTESGPTFTTPEESLAEITRKREEAFAEWRKEEVKKTRDLAFAQAMKHREEAARAIKEALGHNTRKK